MNRESLDAELVNAALQEREAFAVIVERYEQRLRNYVRRITSSDEEITKDVLQETFVKAYVHLNDYDSSLPLSAWLYRIARNETMNYFRAHKNRPQAFKNESDTEIFDRVASELTADTESEQRIHREAVRAAIEKLPFQYREILILRFFEEKSYEEISDILEMPSGTVSVYLTRAKKLLKKYLSGYDAKN